MRFYDKPCNPKLLSPLTLAFIGDTVYDLFVRESVICKANQPVNQLHNKSVEMVKASSQAKVAQRILPLLSEDEVAAFKRGRNAHSSHTPKNMSERDYHYATGVECLCGYLYLQGKIDRLRELFDYIIQE